MQYGRNKQLSTSAAAPARLWMASAIARTASIPTPPIQVLGNRQEKRPNQYDNRVCGTD